MTWPAPELIPYFIYAFAALAAVLAAEVLFLQFVDRRRKIAVNRRLRSLAAAGDAQEEALRTLLRERGLTDTGDYLFGLVWLNRLYAQSGITGNPAIYFGSFAAAGLATGIS
jgi:tight adherence protein B